MDEAARMKMLEVEARVIYEGCAGDMDGWDHEDSASFVADRLYDEYKEFRPEGGIYPIAFNALKGYF